MASGGLDDGKLQGLVKIRDQVVDMLDAHRQPQEGVGHADALAFLGRHLGMGGDGRRTDGGLHPAQADGRAHDFEVLKKGVGADLLAIQLEGQHGTEAGHLLACGGVAGRTAQPGIKHPPHHGVGGQELRQKAGIGGLLLDPQRQGFKAAFQQVAVAGIQAAPQVAGQVKDLLRMGVRRYRNTAAQVAVAAHVFGAAVNDDIDSQFDGFLVDGGGEGVVDDGRNTAGAGEIGNLANIDDPQKRVGGGFDHDDPGPVGDGGGDGVHVGFGKGIADAEAFEGVGDKGVGAAIEFIHQDDVVPCPGKGQNGGAHGRHARTEQDTVFGFFQGADFLDDDILIDGVEVARVGRFFPVQVIIGRGSENRGIDTAGGLLKIAAAVNTSGIGFHDGYSPFDLTGLAI